MRGMAKGSGGGGFAMLVAQVPIDDRLRHHRRRNTAKKHRCGREPLEGQRDHDEPCEEETDSAHVKLHRNADNYPRKSEETPSPAELPWRRPSPTTHPHKRRRIAQNADVVSVADMRS